MPLAADGKRIEPPVSEPSEPKHRPAAVATPEPLDDAPDQWSRCQGLSGGADVRMVVGERAFGELELAEQDRAGLAQLAHDRRVDRRHEVAVQRHARRGGDALGPAQVLDGDRHAVQLRQDLAPADHLLGGARLLERQLGRDQGVRLQRRIEALDPAQHLLGQLDRRDLARGEEPRQLADLEIVRFAVHRRILIHERRRRPLVSGAVSCRQNGGSAPQGLAHATPRSAMTDRLVLTCEHAGNVVPDRYAGRSSSGWCSTCCRRIAAGTRARCCSRARWPSAFSAPLYFEETTRLLVDLNRSVGNPELHSEATRHLTLRERREILEAYYHPHRGRVDAAMAAAVASGDRVVHIASHSFTPELNGHVRTADIGMLYDPGRARSRSRRRGSTRCGAPTRRSGCAATTPTSARATA